MRRRVVIEQSERGWDVWEEIPPDCRSPSTSYPNAAKAAARAMQFMELTLPVTPQNWPEDICIGFVETASDPTSGSPHD